MAELVGTCARLICEGKCGPWERCSTNRPIESRRRSVALPRLSRREHLLAGIAAAAAPPLSTDLVARIERIFDGPS